VVDIFGGNGAAGGTKVLLIERDLSASATVGCSSQKANGRGRPPDQGSPPSVKVILMIRAIAFTCDNLVLMNPPIQKLTPLKVCATHFFQFIPKPIRLGCTDLDVEGLWKAGSYCDGTMIFDSTHSKHVMNVHDDDVTATLADDGKGIITVPYQIYINGSELKREVVERKVPVNGYPITVKVTEDEHGKWSAVGQVSPPEGSSFQNVIVVSSSPIDGVEIAIDNLLNRMKAQCSFLSEGSGSKPL